jgi:RHS repeat-associated protein
VASSLSDLPTLFGQSSNRIIATSEYGYDAAGNQTKIPTADASSGYDQMSYDGENRQVSYTKGGQTTYYSYDGDGRRVKKQNPDNSIVVYVYNVSGQLITEYDSTTAATTQPYQTSYLTADHLGSTRVVTDSGGSVKTRRDYLPFGQEIQSGYGGRTTGMKYALTDGLRQQFTAKERDNESGLDDFGARYYSSAQGRFTGGDPIVISDQRRSSPHTWNLYSYASNNPLFYVDPDGRKSLPLGIANLKGYTMMGEALDTSVWFALNPYQNTTLTDPEWIRQGLPNPSQANKFFRPNVPTTEGYGPFGAWETYEEHNVHVVLTLRIEYEKKNGEPTAYIDLDQGMSIEPAHGRMTSRWSPVVGGGQPPPSFDHIEIDTYSLQKLSGPELQAVARTAGRRINGPYAALSQAILEAVFAEQRRREEEVKKMIKTKPRWPRSHN